MGGIRIIDIHTHILPNIDDGADSNSEAIEMLKRAKKNGTKQIVLTPHFPNKIFENDIDNSIYNKIFNTFTNNPKVKEIGIKLYSGAEIFCTYQTIELIKKNQVITINNTKYVLIEFFENEHCSFIFECVEVLLKQGYMPIIAHIERYFYLQHNAQLIKELKNLGCIIQVNSNSLTCGGIRERFADWIFSNSLAHIVASDAHNTFSRTPNLSLAYEELSHRYSFEYAKKLLEINPSNIILGNAIN